MKLYESPSPNARRVHIFMAEKGIDCERVPIDIRAGENLTEEYLQKNPAGRVPVLELEDGTCITESLPIMEYLEENIKTGKSLLPSDPLKRFEVRRLCETINSGTQPIQNLSVINMVAEQGGDVVQGLGPVLVGLQTRTNAHSTRTTMVSGTSPGPHQLSCSLRCTAPAGQWATSAPACGCP